MIVVIKVSAVMRMPDVAGNMENVQCFLLCCRDVCMFPLMAQVIVLINVVDKVPTVIKSSCYCSSFFLSLLILL